MIQVGACWRLVACRAGIKAWHHGRGELLVRCGGWRVRVGEVGGGRSRGRGGQRVLVAGRCRRRRNSRVGVVALVVVGHRCGHQRVQVLLLLLLLLCRNQSGHLMLSLLAVWRARSSRSRRSGCSLQGRNVGLHVG